MRSFLSSSLKHINAENKKNNKLTQHIYYKSYQQFLYTIVLFFVVFHYQYKQELFIQSTTKHQLMQVKASLPKINNRLWIRSEYKMQKGYSLLLILHKAKLNNKKIQSVINIAKSHVDLKNLSNNTIIHIYHELNYNLQYEVKQVAIKINKMSTYLINIDKNTAQGKWKNLTLKTVQKTFNGIIETTLWESFMASGLNAQVIQKFTDIYSWKIDFSRGSRRGDRWQLVIEQKFSNNNIIDWGKILASSYNTTKYRLFAFIFYSNGINNYYDEKGNNLKELFLRSPLKYGRISSRFQKNRFHPILKISRPHYGIDYAAPYGTPVMAIGDGVITKKGYSKGAGKMLKIKHNPRYASAYKHLSRYAKNIRYGVKVSSGEIIGYVGSTGLALGPHLHFELIERSKYIDPMIVGLPKGKPISKNSYKQFIAQKNKLAFLLNQQTISIRPVVRLIN